MSGGTTSQVCIVKLGLPSIDPARTSSKGDKTGAAADLAFGIARVSLSSFSPSTRRVTEGDPDLPFSGTGGLAW